MKGFIKRIANNGTQIIEIVILVLCSAVPFVFNATELFAEYLASTKLDPENAVSYLVIRAGNAAISAAIFFIVLWRIRSHNKEFLMNRGNAYHQYPYWWYWFCAKILGIRKCNLVRIPIYMQFKLVIRGTFSDYPLDETSYPVIKNEAKPKICTDNSDAGKKEINLVLEDSYAIDKQQIPREKRELKTITISRNGGNCQGRHFSQQYIETIINTARKIERGASVNVFATTNPMNTLHIASRAFALADRGNLAHLYVFQQKDSADRLFELKRHKVY